MRKVQAVTSTISSTKRHSFKANMVCALLIGIAVAGLIYLEMLGGLVMESGSNSMAPYVPCDECILAPHNRWKFGTFIACLATVMGTLLGYLGYFHENHHTQDDNH